MAKGRPQNDNLIPQAHVITVEEASRGGKASAKARKEKRALKEDLRAMMDEIAPNKVRSAFEKNGYDVATHREAIIASMLMGAMKGNPKMVDKVLELIGEDYKVRAREAEIHIAQERLKMDKERAEAEKKAKEAYAEFLKNQQEAQMENDGFMEALMGTAESDWSEEDADQESAV